MEAGARARAATDNAAIVLDFSGLLGAECPKSEPVQSPISGLQTDGNIKTPQGERKPAGGLVEPCRGIEQAQSLFAQHQRAEEERQRSLEAYRGYQENVKRSEQLQSEILKGVKAGEDVYILFLKAAKTISLMTSNTLFYGQIEADTRAIYGRGLDYKPPLREELQDALGRLQRLEAAEKEGTDKDSRERIRRAVQAHRSRVEELETLQRRAAGRTTNKTQP